MTAGSTLRIGVVLEALLDWPLEQVIAWPGGHAPEVTELEIGGVPEAARLLRAAIEATAATALEPA